MSARAFAAAVERAFDLAPRPHPGPRHPDGGGDLHRLLPAWPPCCLVGLHDVIAGRITGGELVAFIFYGVLVGGGVGALSEVWGDLQRAAGATERLMELLHEVPAIRAPAASAGACRPSRRARCASRMSTFRYPTRPDFKALNGFSLNVAARRGGGAGGAQRRRQVHRLPADAALL